MRFTFRGHLHWLPVVILLVTGLLLGLQASAVGTRSRGAEPDSVAEQQDPSIAAPAGIEASGQASQTVYLPVVYQAFGAYRPLPFGVQVYQIGPPSTEKAAEAGAGWVRMPLSWATIEPEDTTPSNYRWPYGLEAEMVSYTGAGVRVIFTLTGNPSWAAAFPGGPVYPQYIGDLVEFLQAVVARYGAAPYNVKHWEMYNEPDNGDVGYASVGWGYFGSEPQAYVDLLEAVYQPIKEVDPEAQVLFGGLAYDNWEPYGPFVQTFLDDVLGIMQDNASYPFDMMNFHYYPVFAANWAAYGIDIIGKTNFIRAKMAAYGADKPLICTETGVRSDCPPDSDYCGSDEGQSRYVLQVYSRSQAAGLELGIWYMLVDPAEIVAPQDGLLYANLDPKLSYGAYQTLAGQLTSAHYVRALEAGETGSDQIEAYVFLAEEGPERIIVAWTNDESNPVLALPGNCLTVVDKYGTESGPICDGADGTLDGTIHVPVGSSPVYLHLP